MPFSGIFYFMSKNRLVTVTLQASSDFPVDNVELIPSHYH